MAVKHTRECGWSHGRHWVHLMVGSAGMVIMTLAMTTTSSGPVLALGGSPTAGMPGTENMPGMTAAAVTAGTTGENAGLGAAPPNSVQQGGGAVGPAVLVALATRRGEALTAERGPERAATEGLSLALTVAAALLALGAVLIAALLGKDHRREPALRADRA